MSSVDPSNLGPKVYKEEQVVTTDDLNSLRYFFFKEEIKFHNEQNIPQAVRACSGHMVIEEILVWLKEGKPDLFKEKGND